MAADNVPSTFVHSTATTIAVPFQLLTGLPLPLLALVACHLDVGSLLRSQRCSSAHYRLRSDDKYMSVAWRWASMKISLTTRLCEWALPERRCIVDDERDAVNGQHFVPVSVWQAALPAFRACWPEQARQISAISGCGSS